MDTHFADWYHQANLKPEHSWLERRWKGVEAAKQDASGRAICELARLYHLKALQTPDFEAQFRQKFHEADNAFQMSGNDFEMSLLAGATLDRIMETPNRKHPIAAALAIVCPTFQDKCAKRIVLDIITRARSNLSDARASLRKDPPSLSTTDPVRFDDETLKPLVEACNANQHAEIGKHLSSLLKSLTPQLKSLTAELRELQEYQLLYREESDILWWVKGDWSRDLEVPFRSIDLAAACVVAGKELADLTRVLPGPLGAPAILDGVLPGPLPDDEEVTLSDAVCKTDRDWRDRLVKSLPPSVSLDLSPVLFAANESLRSGKATAWHSVFKTQFGVSATVKIRPVELAQQVYDECLFHRAIAGVVG